MDLPPVKPLNSGHRYCGTELQCTKLHFTAVLAVAFLVDVARGTSLLLRAIAEGLLPVIYVLYLYALAFLLNTFLNHFR
jgi:hypothetical protein